jgi:hypothetical protein
VKLRHLTAECGTNASHLILVLVCGVGLCQGGQYPWVVYLETLLPSPPPENDELSLGVLSLRLSPNGAIAS